MKIKEKLKYKRKAFTLIEMTIVLFIISLLVLIIIPNLSNQRKNANVIHTNTMTAVVQSQIDAYLSEGKNDKSKVNFQKLKDAGYLTKKQIEQAKSEGIRIANNEAIH
ncbi:competence type IV pilus major pilin ComGC [Lentilactobacillus kribbianus]|uniref:competence type IV pilus major pilin ComGC n=1 Tax=Lentilactobacillus kribbianus TaxID=2729622 RepID=UPI00155708F1|nr:competence type IV pilus major pilin ComGC [Lentilactobacillus kribbianus]